MFNESSIILNFGDLKGAAESAGLCLIKRVWERREECWIVIKVIVENQQRKVLALLSGHLQGCLGVNTLMMSITF